MCPAAGVGTLQEPLQSFACADFYQKMAEGCLGPESYSGLRRHALLAFCSVLSKSFHGPGHLVHVLSQAHQELLVCSVPTRPACGIQMNIC